MRRSRRTCGSPVEAVALPRIDSGKNALSAILLQGTLVTALTLGTARLRLNILMKPLVTAMIWLGPTSPMLSGTRAPKSGPGGSVSS